ncbi:potassium channel family protein [Bacillus rubiinfantis]|uniref:potassium channel family protein n=1 Tax=Bacillus rubiinfantis TaxID=1499680 RepID=UPI0005A919F9|nr:potassium channel protein [Bacillus rubiinfantis]
MSHRMLLHFLRMPLLIRIFFIAIFVLCLFGVIIHLLEPAAFPSIFDGIWWAFITASTVGYGDYVPHTFWGRLTGLLLILLGAGFVSSYFGTLAAAAVTKQDAFSEGKHPFKGNGHIIIIGWNERSKELITKHIERPQPQTIVLVDSTLETNPVSSIYVHFIKGKPQLDETMAKTDIINAEKVLITADRGQHELQADMNTILTLLTIKGLCPDVTCIVEILSADQVINAYRAGADEVIQSNKLTSIFMVNSLHACENGLLSSIITQLEEDRIICLPHKSAEGKKTVADAFKELQPQGILLIGLKRGEEIILNPSPNFELKATDELITLN